VGESGAVGPVRWQVLGPARDYSDAGESAANNASTVLLLESRGVRILTGGDIEPSAQAGLRRSVPGLRADVLKVPHHGSSHQDEELLTGVGARVALVSVGAENTYGHPAPRVLDLLERSGAVVGRTDLGGDLAVVLRGDRLSVVSAERGS
jgi:competence protein ComEC